MTLNHCTFIHGLISTNETWYHTLSTVGKAMPAQGGFVDFIHTTHSSVASEL